MDDIKTAQIELAICKMKTTLNEINGRLNIKGEKTSALEDTAIQTNQNEIHRENIILKIIKTCQ